MDNPIEYDSFCMCIFAWTFVSLSSFVPNDSCSRDDFFLNHAEIIWASSSRQLLVWVTRCHLAELYFEPTPTLPYVLLKLQIPNRYQGSYSLSENTVGVFLCICWIIDVGECSSCNEPYGFSCCRFKIAKEFVITYSLYLLFSISSWSGLILNGLTTVVSVGFEFWWWALVTSVPFKFQPSQNLFGNQYGQDLLCVSVFTLVYIIQHWRLCWFMFVCLKMWLQLY